LQKGDCSRLKEDEQLSQKKKRGEDEQQSKETDLQNLRVSLHQTKQVLELGVITQNIKVPCAGISGSIRKRLQFRQGQI